MKIALCNEVVRELEFSAQCDFAASIGYDGLELAPFTLGENPHLLSSAERLSIRRAASDAGLEITGLHWLLLTPKGLSINSRDHSVRQKTIDVLRRLIALTAEMGGKVLVHGSPAQRQVESGDNPADAWQRARDTFAAIAPDAESAGVTYCIEPLSQQECNFINTVAEAVQLAEAVGSPAVKTMLDNRAASLAEAVPVTDLIDRWLPAGWIRHIHVNDTNRRAPGQGESRFSQLLGALLRHNYAGVVSVEPFEYFPDGKTAAALALGYLRGILESLGVSSQSCQGQR